MKVVFLVINYMPHQIVSIKSLISNYDVEVHSFNFADDHTIPVDINNFHAYRLNLLNRSEFLSKVLFINPKMLVVAGWAVKDFVWISKLIRAKLNIPVVSYSDTQWRNTFKQKINCLLSPFHLQKAFSHLWVSGIYQFEYARKLGFKRNKIILNSLVCDFQLFSSRSIEFKDNAYPKNFLFIGRFVPVKGLDLLIGAWKQISDKKGWSLTLIGDGSLKTAFYNIDGVIVKEFMPQKDLLIEFEKSGCFVLPSRFEPWALVIHEASAAGLPIIATDVCGAAPHFIINGYNGYQVKPSIESIKTALENIISMDEIQLLKFSKNSRKLSESMTPELGAAQLMSVLNDY